MSIFGGIYCGRLNSSNPESLSRESIPYLILLIIGILIGFVGLAFVIVSFLGMRIVIKDYEGFTILIYAGEKNLLIVDDKILDKKIIGQTFEGTLPNGEKINVIVDHTGHYMSVNKIK